MLGVEGHGNQTQPLQENQEKISILVTPLSFKSQQNQCELTFRICYFLYEHLRSWRQFKIVIVAIATRKGLKIEMD